jgi:hypothetical protein
MCENSVARCCDPQLWRRKCWRSWTLDKNLFLLLLCDDVQYGGGVFLKYCWSLTSIFQLRKRELLLPPRKLVKQQL